MKKFLLAAVIGAFTSFQVMAQISEGGLPVSFAKTIAGSASPFDAPYQIKTAPVPDVQAAIIEDAQGDQKGSYRIGLNTFVDYSIQNSGTWLDLPNGDKLWRLGIRSAGADAITLYFGAPVAIPQGGKLFAYNQRQSQYVGAYTSNTPGFQSMEMIQGDVITLEYYMPAGATALPIISVSEIAHIYRGAGERIDFFATGSVQNQNRAQACEVDVACAGIAGWEMQRDAVLRYTFVSGGTFLCSASIVNNTNNDCKPYVLTANHCGEPDANNDITNHTWYFNYQRPTCSPGNTTPYSGAQSQTMSGGFLRASSSLGNQPASNGNQVDGSDFVLIELSTTIPGAYNPYFAGWNRSTTATAGGAGIHHPSGHEKKISKYTQTPGSATYNGGWSAAHWSLVWTSGVTEGGSSGSPLFNSSGLVIGHLSGGLSACTVGGAGAGTGPTQADLYGKFSKAWDQEGTNANQRLKPWLDPTNSGSMSIAGTYSPCGPTAPIAEFVANQTVVLPATTVSFTDQSSGAPTSWAWTVSPGTGWVYTGGTNATSQNPQIIFNTLGFYTIGLTATNAQGSDLETKTNYIQVASVVGPCAASGTTDCTAGTASEYISNVTCNTINNTSACSDYSDFTSMSTTLAKSSTYTVTVSPSVAGGGAGAYTNDEIAAWIDWNDDADFNDAGEQVGYVLVSGTFNPTFTFTVPAGAVTGTVVMRCRISYQPDDGAIDPCGVTTWGEVEDYTINIIPATGGTAPVAQFVANQTNVVEGTVVNFTDQSTNAPTSWAWTITPASGWSYSGGSTAASQNPSVLFSTAGTYTVMLTATNATGSDSETKTSYITVTEGIGFEENDLSNITIYPNPTNGELTVNLSKVASTIETVELRDITGRVIAVKSVNGAFVEFDLAKEAAGIYFVKVNSANSTITKKIVKY